MSRLRRVAAVAVTTFLISGLVLPAQADPDAVAEAKADLERIQEQSSAIDQEIIEASDRAVQGQTKLAEVTADLEQQEALVSGMSTDLGEIAVVQLQSGGFDITAQLLTSDSESSFLSGLATIQNEANRSNANLQLLQVEQAEADALRAEADRTNVNLQSDLQAKQDLAVEFEAKEAEAEAVHDRLSEEERERLRQIEIQRQREQEEADRLARVAAEQAAELEAERSAEREAEQSAEREAEQSSERETETSDDASDESERPSESNTTAPEEKTTAPEEKTASPVVSNSGRAQSAISAATSKVGSSYVWGSSGPSTFDCSGLMSYAYRQVGISLPRSSRAQFGMGTNVAKSDLQPGDLVFYYSPVSHVAMYIGDGKIVDAANPRSGVRITSVNSMPYSGARRVG